MKVISIFVLLLCTSLCIMAQEPGKVVQTIKGKVINASTNEPVSYTNIGLQGTYYGTASDNEGNFELKIPHEMISKDIFFSAVGFKNRQFPVTDLFDKEFSVIKIESQSYGIEDVDIAAQNKVLIRILRMASENIPYNFIRGPYNLTASYVHEKTIGGTTEKTDADVSIYDQKGYANPSKSDAYQSLKYSVKKDVLESDYRFSSSILNIDELLELDWARSASSVLNSKITNGFSLKLLDEPSINGQNFWVISFSQAQPTLAGSGDYYASSFAGEITINKEDYSVLKIKGQVESPKNNRQGKSLAIGGSNTGHLTDVSYDFAVDYESLKPSKIELNKKYTVEGKAVSVKSLLQIEQVKATDITKINSRDYFTGK